MVRNDDFVIDADLRHEIRMEPTGIEPVTSCLQSGCADAGWRRYTPVHAEI